MGKRNNKKIFSFSLDPELIERLKPIADKEHRSVSNILETLIITKVNMQVRKDLQTQIKGD